MRRVKVAYDWLAKKSHSRHAYSWLALFQFLESSCFFIPADPLLIIFSLEHRERSYLYGIVATIASVTGGFFGYCIGAFLWNTVGPTILAYVISQATFDAIVQKYEAHQAFVVLFGGLMPIPFKVITISAGFCKLSLLPFIAYSFISRGIRFMTIAWLIHRWGNHIKNFIDQYFSHLVFLFLGICVGLLLFFKFS
jgi:membrane protein YqaA with SNARE-associated domain